MAVSLKSLKSSANQDPPLIMLHAVEGVGKTSLAAEFPNSLYVHTAGEATPRGIEIDSPGQLETYQDMVGLIQELATEEHDYKTFILDAIDGFQPLVWRETCARNKWANIEDPGFGKGYLAADDIWREILEGFDHLRTERGMTVILICHSDRVQHDEPGTAPYKRYDLRVQKRAQAILCDACDYILFIGSKVELKEVDVGFNKKHSHAEGGATRYIFTDARPAFVAKNRANGMPPQILYIRGKGYEKLAPWLFPQSGKAGESNAEAPTEQSEAA